MMTFHTNNEDIFRPHLSRGPAPNPCIAHQVVALGRDDFGDVRVPQHQVCVGAHCNAPLAGVQIKDLGSVGAGDGYKLVLIHLPSYLEENDSRESSVCVCVCV